MKALDNNATKIILAYYYNKDEPLKKFPFILKYQMKADGEESAYQYCGGEPVNKVDPSGRSPLVWTAIKIAFFIYVTVKIIASAYSTYVVWKQIRKCKRVINRWRRIARSLRKKGEYEKAWRIECIAYQTEKDLNRILAGAAADTLGETVSRIYSNIWRLAR